MNVGLTFNGSASSDPDGSVVGYQWICGDGGDAAGSMPVHAYAATGVYTVVLTVTDDSGSTGNATTTAEIVPVVANQAPTANVAGPFAGRLNDPVAFDGSHSSDSDGSVVFCLWDFGDGTQGAGIHPNTTHSYASVGNYTATLRVADNDGIYKCSRHYLRVDPQER